MGQIYYIRGQTSSDTILAATTANLLTLDSSKDCTIGQLTQQHARLYSTARANIIIGTASRIARTASVITTTHTGYRSAFAAMPLELSRTCTWCNKLLFLVRSPLLLRIV
uniref:Uncharacterized protein n=1 Tax=Trichogramma kaykai TaxID=54128 RepID=A0ABD2XEC0_9HYME